jgi:hypothetical protein
VTRKREFLDYLEDILDAAEKIGQFTASMTLEQFAEDEKTIYAVVRAFEIVGEAAKKVPRAVRKRNPSVLRLRRPWRRRSEGASCADEGLYRGERWRLPPPCPAQAQVGQPEFRCVIARPDGMKMSRPGW